MKQQLLPGLLMTWASLTAAVSSCCSFNMSFQQPLLAVYPSTRTSARQEVETSDFERGLTLQQQTQQHTAAHSSRHRLFSWADRRTAAPLPLACFLEAAAAAVACDTNRAAWDCDVREYGQMVLYQVHSSPSLGSLQYRPALQQTYTVLLLNRGLWRLQDLICCP